MSTDDSEALTRGRTHRRNLRLFATHISWNSAVRADFHAEKSNDELERHDSSVGGNSSVGFRSKGTFGTFGIAKRCVAKWANIGSRERARTPEALARFEEGLQPTEEVSFQDSDPSTAEPLTAPSEEQGPRGRWSSD